MGNLRVRELDNKYVRELIVRAIIEHSLPFKFVEYKWIRELLAYSNLDVKHVIGNTIVSNVLKFHNELKEKLKHVMKKCHNQIFVDGWTA